METCVSIHNSSGHMHGESEEGEDGGRADNGGAIRYASDRHLPPVRSPSRSNFEVSGNLQVIPLPPELFLLFSRICY
ncbi:hypothetical protein KSP39_PZI020549 [Platanthera zijinensis]|uniref:Uncharacterized protein n=1 Tax=Platanthera zijinensis TaxID=2320716 RepID=A0AAP0B0S2_9ASPA